MLLSSTPHLTGILTLVGIGTDCIGSYESNYHTIATMMALIQCRNTRLFIKKEGFLISVIMIKQFTKASLQQRSAHPVKCVG
jgi:hypothetical protein